MAKNAETKDIEELKTSNECRADIAVKHFYAIGFRDNNPFLWLTK